jgi:cyanophycinase-like exopeptidase
MTGRITLIGAGELMSAMSSMHRAALSRLGQTPRPVFLDTTAGFETNVGAIAEKAVEYYAHHRQTDLKVASYRHRERASASEPAAAVAAVRESNLIFAGPGSPTYAIRQWRDSPLWQAVTDRFMEGADVLFASAASICLGRYALPVYEIYKAGEDPYWADGLDLLSHFGLSLAIVPHYDDASGGENYDSRFCYMGARRFDELQRQLPADVSIVGIDAYTSICFDPATRTASIAGQGGITLIGGHGQERFEAGATVPFETFSGGSRENVTMFNASEAVSGYAFADDAEESDDPMQALQAHINSLDKLTGNEKVDILARLHQVEAQLGSASPESEGQLVDLVIELRKGMREAKRFDLADRARDALLEAGYEIQDTPEGTRWTRQ